MAHRLKWLSLSFGFRYCKNIYTSLCQCSRLSQSDFRIPSHSSLRIPLISPPDHSKDPQERQHPRRNGYHHNRSKLWVSLPSSSLPQLICQETNLEIHSWVILAAAATFWMGGAHTANTGKFRKAAQVAYPNAYAPESRTDEAAIRFNCAQRSHANYVENQVQMLPALLLAGLEYPRASAAMGGFWVLSRFAYMVGYSKGGNGKGRYEKGGAAFWLAQVGLISTATWVGAKLILGW